MKTLVKISFVLVCALFLSMSVKADDTDTNKSGTITVKVPKQLKLTLANPNFDLTYKQNDISGSTLTYDAMTYQVDANVAWKISVSATGNTTVLGALSYTFDGETAKTLSSAVVAKTGSKNKAAAAISWALNATAMGNIDANEAGYLIEVAYVLSE